MMQFSFRQSCFAKFRFLAANWVLSLTSVSLVSQRLINFVNGLVINGHVFNTFWLKSELKSWCFLGFGKKIGAKDTLPMR